MGVDKSENSPISDSEGVPRCLRLPMLCFAQLKIALPVSPLVSISTVSHPLVADHTAPFCHLSVTGLALSNSSLLLSFLPINY